MAYLKEGYWRYVGVMAIACLIVLLAGCSMFDGFGDDSSRLKVGNSCDVDLRQHALVDGDDSSKVVESVKISPDCTTVVEFKQDVEPK